MGKSRFSDKNGLRKGPWTAEEDQKLIDYIQKHGHGRWRTLPKNAGLKRCGKSCRLRWTNYLRPDIKRGKFSAEEEETIIQLHSVLGNKWSAIAARLPGRTDNEIKNYWNTHIKKKLLRMGIDPVTHTPRFDLFDQLSSILGSSLLSSSQLSVPSLLGMGSVMNPELRSLATALLSFQAKNPETSRQNLQENQYLCPPTGNQQPHSQINQACTTSSDSNAQFLNEHHLSQASYLTQFSPSCPTHLSSQNMLPTNLSNGFLPITSYACDDTNQPINNILTENEEYYPNKNIANLSFTSLLSSTPSSTSTPLNSSSTAYITGGPEDERDSYSSSLFMFDIPGGLNVNRCL